MPISDYGSHLGSASVVVIGFRGRMREWWMRLRHRDTVEGYRFEGMK
jgi:hypothetical protein